MINELTKVVARTAQLRPEQAEMAVRAMLNFFTARLPSRLVGELHAYLKTSVVTTAPTVLSPLDKPSSEKIE